MKEEFQISKTKKGEIISWLKEVKRSSDKIDRVFDFSINTNYQPIISAPTAEGKTRLSWLRNHTNELLVEHYALISFLKKTEKEYVIRIEIKMKEYHKIGGAIIASMILLAFYKTTEIIVIIFPFLLLPLLFHMNAIRKRAFMKNVVSFLKFK